MSEPTKTLEEMVREVPSEYRAQLRDYVESLLARRSIEQPGKPQFMWAGALEGLRDRYTSVELQHRIARWRTDGE
ncbi:MAG: DUF2281 domain-containing protein [Terriglobia bacterium]|jgi:hypothetical protein